MQRTEAGTVFTYLPVKVGERIDDEKAAQAIKALYATGFYPGRAPRARRRCPHRRGAGASRHLVDRDRGREGIHQGQPEGRPEAGGHPEAKIYDKSILDRAEKELKRQYTSRGFYGAVVKTTVTPLERNRVSLRFDIEEGSVTKIADINIIGAKDFTEKELLREMKLSTPGWFTWFTKDDQYSKQQLTPTSRR